MSRALRTRAIELDRDFTVTGHVAKTRVDAATGERYITGLASGLEEDRDGERVSANAIRKMVAQPVDDLRLTSSHDQDWLTEIGTVTKHWHDADHDELWVETKLPAEGEDPIADKAWRESQKRPLGFSIGGKLRKAFREIVNENGVTKQRKVLDDIWLRHYALTAKPSYTPSFAEAVAKTWDGTPAREDEFTDELEDGVVFDRTEEIRKAAKDAAEKPGREAGDPTDDEPGEKDAPAGTETAGPGKDGEDAPESDAAASKKDAEALPMAKRHLACPHCGHEFAAPLSADETGNRQPDEDDADDGAVTTKTTTQDMSATPTNLSDALERVRALADVAKTEAGTTEKANTEVAKTEETGELTMPEVAKAIATLAEGQDDVVTKTAEALSGLTEVVKSLAERVAELPQGRKSVGRVLEGRLAEGVAKSDDDAEMTVEKARKALDDAPDALSALNIVNEARARGLVL